MERPDFFSLFTTVSKNAHNCEQKCSSCEHNNSLVGEF